VWRESRNEIPARRLTPAIELPCLPSAESADSRKVQLQTQLQLAWRIVQISGTAHAPEIRLSPTGHEFTVEKIPHVHAGNIGADRQ